MTSIPPENEDERWRVINELTAMLGLREPEAGRTGLARPAPGPACPRDRVEAARAWIKLRRLREKVLGSDLFADPAWDIMLDLYIQHHLGKPTQVSSACLAAHVPPTTALRWLGRLEEEGVIARSSDPNDGRRMLVHLTQETIDRLDEVLTGFLHHIAVA